MGRLSQEVRAGCGGLLAVVVLREAAAAEPANAEAWGHLAAGLAEFGQREQALDAIGHAVRLQPASGAAWLLRATLQRRCVA